MSGNNLKTIPIMIVTLVIGFIMVTAAVIPLAADYSEAKTFKNKGYYDMVYTETDNLVFEWDHTTPNKVTVNDEVITLPDADYVNKTLICGDDWLARYGYDSSLKAFVQFYGSSGSQVIASVSAETDLSITCSNGSVSVANTASPAATFTATYTHLYVVSNTGDLVMKMSDDPVYLNGNTEIIAMGLSKVGTISGVGVIITGNLDDGFTWGIFRGSDITFSDQAVTSSTVSGYKNLYLLEKLTATATNSTGSTDLTYSYFIVPAEVTADNDNPATFKNLIRIVPLISIVALVAMAAGMLYLKGKE